MDDSLTRLARSGGSAHDDVVIGEYGRPRGKLPRVELEGEVGLQPPPRIFDVRGRIRFTRIVDPHE